MVKVMRNSATRTFPFTFPDSGVVVQLKKVNPYITSEVRTMLSKGKPKPPVRIVQEEGPLKGTEEVMDHDPDYIEKLREWEAEIDEKVMQLQIKRGVVKIEVDDWKEEVAQLRADLEEIGAGGTLPEDDSVAYICYIASSTANDLQDFITAIAMRSQPTHEMEEAAKESFRANVEKP